MASTIELISLFPQMSETFELLITYAPKFSMILVRKSDR